MTKRTKDEIREILTRDADWRNRTAGVALGTYIMQDATPNHDVLIDRRCSVDWRVAEDLPAGEYVIEDATHVRRDHDEKYDGPPWLRMWRVQNNGTLYDVTCADERFWTILSMAKKTEETPSRWLVATRNENWALEMLDALVEHNQVSMRTVKASYEAAVTKWEAEDAQ